MKSKFTNLSIFIILVITLVGCREGEQLQLDVQQALDQHTEMNNYRFTGSALLSLESPAAGWSTNPLTAGLLTMITNGQLSWEGVASIEPLRLELSIKLTPAGSTNSIDIPLLLQDNKLYIHIPAINEHEQYYEIDLDQLSELSGNTNSLTPERVTDVAQMFSSIVNELISATNPKQFEEITDDDSNLRSIHITMNQKNKEVVINIWYTSLPNIVSRLKEAGMIQAETHDRWQEILNASSHDIAIKNSDQFTLNKPLTMHMIIDENGFMTESHVIADITLIDKDQQTKNWSFDVTNRYHDINQNPPFTKEIPVNIKPFSDILEQISGFQK